MPRPKRPGPPLVLAGGILAVAALLALTTALQIARIAAFDETVYKLSASLYAAGGLDALLHDQVARGSARLYSLLIAPLFAVLAADDAVSASRALNSVLWAAAAVPLYLLARRVMASPWGPVAAALLAIAVPWATISTVLFSEALAYLLFAWALWAMAGALRAPSPWRDLLVLVLLAALVGTRVQFIALPVAWTLVVLGLELPRARREAASWRGALVATWRRFPFLLTVAAAGALVFLTAVVVGSGGTLVRRATGPYIGTREQLPSDVGQAVLFEVAMLALGTGLIPIVLAAAWWRAALRGEAGPEALRVTVLGLALVAATFGVAIAGQGGWQGPDVAEERYYLYGVPVILLGALAALELPRLRAATIAWGGLAVACLLALAPVTAGLSGERAFLVPVAASAANLDDRVNPWLADLAGLEAFTGQRDLLVVLALVVTLAALAGWRRARWLVLVPAVAVQLGFAGYALATMHGEVPGVAGITGRVPSELSWVDQATPGDGDVALLADRAAAEQGALLDLAFWNDEPRAVLRLPGVELTAPPYPVSGLDQRDTRVGDDLLLTPAPAVPVVAARDAAGIQLAGRPVGEREGSGVLLALDRPARATWVARGLAPDGALPGPVPVTAAPARVTLVLEAPAGTAGGTVRASLGERARSVTLAGGQSTEVALEACGGRGPVTGTLAPSIPEGGAVLLRSVRIEPCP